jgi:hypothetical protein
MAADFNGINMEDFKEKYYDLIKRGFEIGFYEKVNYSLFSKREEKTYYVVLKKNGKEPMHFPSRVSSQDALCNVYNLLPKIEDVYFK